MKKYMLFLVLFTFTSVVFSQKNDNTKSILFVKNLNSKNTYINTFNKNLKHEITSKSLYLYTFNDLSKNEAINLKFYYKPISKYAYENFREIEFYRKSIPKQVNLINFQRNINN